MTEPAPNPFDPQDADPLDVMSKPYPGWSRDDLSPPDPEWQPLPVSRGVRRWVVLAAFALVVAVCVVLVVVTR